MKYTFKRGEHNLSQWCEIIRQMQSVLDEVLRRHYSEKELSDYLAAAIQDARPVNGGLYWGFDDPEHMPSDARCEFFYQPSYIMTLTLANAVLQFPGLLDMPKCRETLHGALVGCMGRGLSGHGYDSDSELYHNLKLFLSSNILTFLVVYPDIGREFACMLDKIMKGINTAYIVGDHISGWNQNYRDEQEEVLSLYPFVGFQPGRTLYFAYGSNMDETQMAHRCPKAERLANVTVYDYRFALDEAGVATILPSRGDCVEGLLWSVTDSDVESLDRYEGVSSHCYRKETLAIDEYRPGYEALVYISNRELTPLRERSGYMDRIIKAAIEHGFSESYIEMLRTFCSDKGRK